MSSAAPLLDLSPDTTSLAEIDALRRSIGWGPGSWFLGPMMESGGCILGIRDQGGALLAMGGAAVFPPAGFICNMVVRPDQKRRGLGRQVFEALIGWLGDSGFPQIQLEATEEGRPLYEQYGFVTRWESVTSTLQAPPERGDEAGLRPLEESDWAAIARLDQEATGMARGSLLARLARQRNFGGGLVAADADGIDGYALRFDGRIGPVVAGNAEIGARLARALAARCEPGTLATVGHPQHTRMWQSLGFEVTPFDVRMSLGPQPQDQPGMVFCMLNGGAG